MTGELMNRAEKRRGGGGSASLWAVACLLVVASALSLAPGTALAQTDSTPPTVERISVAITFTGNSGTIRIYFTGDITSSAAPPSSSISVYFDGVHRVPNSVSRISNEPNAIYLTVGGTGLHLAKSIVVSYSSSVATADGIALRAGDDNELVASFTWEAKGRSNPLREIPPEQAAYAALGRYFEGTGSLSEAETFVSTYYEDVKARLAAGDLSTLFRIGQADEPRTAWGTDGTENWGQVGFPWGFPREICTRANDPSSCKDMSEIWGSQYRCGGRNMPGFSGGDHVNFFWACSHLTESGQETANSQWVPVKRHRPGVDYSHDHELKRPGTAEYNNDCLYRDENGNPAPVFRADFHPQDHLNPQLRGKPIRRPDGSIQGTTIHGGNWDPLAKQCTTRGNR